MKRLFCSFILLLVFCTGANAEFTSCGAGYVLVRHASIDGIKTQECQKLWCHDLETGKPMGVGKNANSGYKMTDSPVELCDAEGTCVECFGERRWCANEVPGHWYAPYGAYTRGGDNATYQSYQKGGCFAWNLEKPDCDGGKAVLKGGRWVCSGTIEAAKETRATSVRRTGTLRHIK